MDTVSLIIRARVKTALENAVDPAHLPQIVDGSVNLRSVQIVVLRTASRIVVVAACLENPTAEVETTTLSTVMSTASVVLSGDKTRELAHLHHIGSSSTVQSRVIVSEV